MEFGEVGFATRLRDAVRRITETEVARLRPPVRYGMVQSYNRATRKASVLMAGDTDPITVGMGSIQPSANGQRVRVEGPSGDKYITDVIGAAPYIDGSQIGNVAALTATTATNSTQLGGVAAASYLRTNGKAADSELLDGIDSTGFLRTTGKAADADLLDGKDGAYYMPKSVYMPSYGDDPGVTMQIPSINVRLTSGYYNLTGNPTGTPPAFADGRWYFLQVIAHGYNTLWQRQIAYDMTGGSDTFYTRRGSDSGGTSAWSSWVSK